MPQSLPSKEVYNIDIPEIKNFRVDFQYNYFVPDEQINEVSGIPDTILNKVSEFETEENIQILKTKFPRYIKFQWEKCNSPEEGNRVTDTDIRKRSFKVSSIKGLLKNNYDKVITEDYFSNNLFSSVSFHDSEIDKKIHHLISCSYQQRQLTELELSADSIKSIPSLLETTLPKEIDSGFLSKGFLQENLNQNTQHYGPNSIGSSAEKKSSIKDFSLEKIKHSFLNTKLNSKLISNILKTSIQKPQTPFDTDLHSLYLSTKNSSFLRDLRLSISESDFKTYIPYLNFKIAKTAFHNQAGMSSIVGYIIDKFEVSKNGSLIKKDPIIIENSEVSSAWDPAVKYNADYCYSIRSIALYELPAIDDDTNQIAFTQMLVSSKPSAKVYIKIHDDVAPPPPTEINFTWDYQKEKLMIHWSFPINPQRDIKKFQVFRRKNIDHPFELIKLYDFDDSLTKIEINESPIKRVTHQVNSPVTFYIDDDFTKDTDYIYTLCSIDAHGLTSGYGPQYQISFDRFKNQLIKKLVSHSGAPKQYPNMYLEGAGFVNSANINGSYTKRMFVYFTPQFYQIEDEHQRTHRVVSTKQSNGSYKFQFINVDNQKSQILTVKIDDKINMSKNRLKFPSFRFSRLPSP
jgi:hypothetical protein